MFDLSGMTALVTGASGGIGSAIARALAGQGARVALSGTREEALRAVQSDLGGDHVITLPILRAIAKKHGPVGLIHIDAHADVNEHMFGEPIAHGTPFRRAQEEGLLAHGKVVQIGLRGTGYAAEDFDWCRQQGFRVVTAEECWYRSLAPLMAEVREQMGDTPVYVTFDIDGLDPSVAPGTGTSATVEGAFFSGINHHATMPTSTTATSARLATKVRSLRAAVAASSASASS